MLSSPDFLSHFRTIWHFIELCLTIIFVATLLLLLGYHAYICLCIWVYGREEAILEEADPSSPSFLARRREIPRGETDDVEAGRVKYEYESVVDREDAHGYGTV